MAGLANVFAQMQMQNNEFQRQQAFRSLGAGILGGGLGFLVGGPFGGALGFGAGILGSSQGMQGGPSSGAIGGGLLGGLAGLLIGGPVGLLAGGLLGGLLGSAFGHPQPPGGGGFMPPPYGGGGFGGFGYGGGFFPQQGCGCGCHQGMVPEGTPGSINQGAPGQPLCYTSHGGFKVSMNGGTVTITDPSGKQSVQEWGDPHENVNGRHVGDWQGNARTLLLPDGTRVTMNATAANGTIQNTSVYDGNQSFNFNNTNNTVTSETTNPYQTMFAQLNQAEGETGVMGFNCQGGLTLNDLFYQNPDFSVRPDQRRLA